MEYKIIRSRRKTISIYLNNFGEIIVKCPNKCSLKFIENFVQEKAEWIKKQKFKVDIKNKKIIEYKKNNKVLLFGNSYEIIDNKNHYKIGDYYIKHSKANNKEKIIKNFIISLANDYIINKTKQIAQQLGVDYNDIKIISARKKWGSCNNLKQLKFNFRLVMLPNYLIDYVICHELCHLIELNHSKQFWNLLKKLGYEKNKVKTAFSEYNFVLELF